MADKLSIQRAIRRSLDSLVISQPIRFGRLQVWYLSGGELPAVYEVLDHMIESAAVHVTEIDDGLVEEVQVLNGTHTPLLLVDGEELLGALQNRSINVSVIVPPMATLNVPVSCMEAGRWDERGGPEFRRSEHIMSARLRMNRTRQVSTALRRSDRDRRSDQDVVWSEIDELQSDLGTSSETKAINDAYLVHQRAMNKYIAAMPSTEGARGAIFALDSGPHGLELFESKMCFAALQPKILRSWAVDAIAAARKSAGSRDALSGSEKPVDPRILLDRLARRTVRLYDSIGDGTDFRLLRRGSRLHGAGLAVGDRLIHFTAFHSGFGSHLPAAGA